MTPARPARRVDHVADDAFWEAYVRELDPQQACELLGIEHFPHYLAAAANLALLAQHLQAKYGAGVKIKDALISELKKGPYPPSGSKNTTWWKAMEPHLPVVEEVVKHYLRSTGNLNLPWPGED
jgi:hypothetical protein